MLIERYELRMESPPCDPGSERWSAFAELDADISAALPYLNATLRGAVYNQVANVLTWKKGVSEATKAGQEYSPLMAKCAPITISVPKAGYAYWLAPDTLRLLGWFRVGAAEQTIALPDGHASHIVAMDKFLAELEDFLGDAA